MGPKNPPDLINGPDMTVGFESGVDRGTLGETLEPVVGVSGMCMEFFLASTGLRVIGAST